MFKQQNVTPIDLAPLVEDVSNDVKHSKAISIFLNWLASSKPNDRHVWEWPSEDSLPRSTAFDDVSTSPKEIFSAWRQDRLKYPGWLVAPGETQEIFRYRTNAHYPQLQKLAEIEKISEKAQLLFELLCRHEIAFSPVNEQYDNTVQEMFRNGGKVCLLQQEKTRLCAFLCAEARRRWDWISFDFWISELESFDDPEASTELFYGKALRAKQELDFVTLNELVPKIAGEDPVWKMRQGMLYTFLFEDEKAALCFQSALTDIRMRRATDKRSIWLLSREAWARWVFDAAHFELPENDGKHRVNLDGWPSIYGQKRCDPWDYLGFLDRKVAEDFEKTQGEKILVTPLFNAGHYRNIAKGKIHMNSARVTSHDLCVRMQETVGIPTRIGWADLLSTRLSRAFEVINRSSERDYFLAATLLPSYEKGLIDTAFNRIEVAKIPIDVVVKLAEKIRCAIDYFLSKYTSSDRRLKSIDRVRIDIELLSRLAVRMSSSAAREYYEWTLALCWQEAANDWWLYEHIGNLLERCLEAMPIDDRRALAETAVFFPLPVERKIDAMARDWPELMDCFQQEDFQRPEKNTAWAGRVSELIAIINNESTEDRQRAILRMHLLFKSNLLLEDEESELAKAIWSTIDEYKGWPLAFNMYPYVFLELPETKKDHAKELFYAQFVEKVTLDKVDADFINTLSGGLNSSKNILECASDHFENILLVCMNWKPRSADSDSLRDVGFRNDADKRAITNLLTWTLLPEIKSEDIAPETKEKWLAHLASPDYQGMVATAFEFSRLYPEELGSMVRLIRKSIYSRNSKNITSGYHAIQQFINAAKIRKREVPEILVSDVISACESMRELGLHHALHAAVQFVETSVVGDDGLRRLADTVELIWSEFSYDVSFSSDERMITLTLVRGQCARMAKVLMNLGMETDAVKIICEEALNDPAPEVRYSI